MSEQTNTNGKASLYAKIARVASEVTSVGKDGYNPQLKYKYATPASVIEAVKPVMAAHNLAIVPTVAGVVKEDTGGKTSSGAAKVLTRVEMIYLILDGDTGESLAAPWCGEGEDWSDKGIAKAQTIALRTFLLNLFQIPSVDEDTDPDAKQAQPPRGGAQYQEAPRQPVQGAQPRTNKPNAPQAAPMSDVSRATTVTRIRTNMRRAQDFGFNDARKLAVDLEALTDADLMMADKVWKERADTLTAEDARGIAA